MSDDLAELAEQTAEQLGNVEVVDQDAARFAIAYATGVLRALAVALRPPLPVLRTRGDVGS